MSNLSIIYDNYKYVLFLSSQNIIFEDINEIDYLVIGGGGSGGNNHGGGGGAGRVTNGTIYKPKGNYLITVGKGGFNSNGGDSSAFGTKAYGGGRGGGQASGIATSGGSGGGGSGYVYPSNPGENLRQTYYGYGNNGGMGFKTATHPSAGGGGGGGGAGSSGGNAPFGTNTNSLGGNAGSGIRNFSEWITAISSLMPNNWKEVTKDGYIAGGGAGGSWGANIISGGLGGGGKGGTNNGRYGIILPTNGINYTGSGGGGGGSGGQFGANGGDGLVIVRYLITSKNILTTADNLLLLTQDYNDTGILKSKVTKNGSVEIKSYNGKTGAYFNNSLSNFLNLSFNNPSKFTFSYWMCAINNNNYTIASISDINSWSPVFQCDMVNNILLNYIAMPNQWNVTTNNSIDYVNKWIHLTYTVDQTNFNVKQYINGNLVSNVRGNQPLPIRNNYIIGRSGDNGRAFYGYVHCFCTFNYILTNDQVKSLYEATQNIPSPVPPTPPPPVNRTRYVFSPNEFTTIRPNMITKKWAELDIDSNLSMFIEFSIIITSLSPSWRNIFHFSNDGTDRSRVPSSWIAPNQTALHFQSSSEENWAGGLAQLIPFNTETHIVITSLNGNINIYLNSVLKITVKLPGNLIKANDQTILYISDPWAPTDNGFKIKNLTFGNLSDSLKCGVNKFCLGYEPDNKVYCYGASGGCLWGQNSCNTDTDCRTKYNMLSPKYTDGDQPDCTGLSGWRNPDACPQIYNRSLDNKSGSTRYTFSPNEWSIIKPNLVSKKWPELNIDSNLDMFIEYDILITSFASYWRNIFQFVGSGNSLNRVPDSAIAPNDTAFNIYFTAKNGSDVSVMSPRIGLNTKTHVVITINNNMINFYFDSVLKSSQKISGNTFDNLLRADDNTTLYISSPDTGIKIKNFTVGNLSDSLKCSSVNKVCLGFEPDNKVYCYGSSTGCLWGGTTCNTDNDCKVKYSISSLKYTDGEQPKCTIGSSWKTPDACPQIYKTDYDKSIDNQSCNYQLNNTELKCYQQRYPNDLLNMTNSQLQEHWSTKGCNEERDNQCPAPQKTSGLYEYKGCFNGGIEGLTNSNKRVTSVDECNSIAESNNETFFGIKNYGECWVGNNEIKVLQYGENLNGNSCGIMGKNNTLNIYKRTKDFPPPLPPIPNLKKSDFFESFLNKNENNNDKKYMKMNNYIIFLIIFIVIIIFFMLFNK